MLPPKLRPLAGVVLVVAHALLVALDVLPRYDALLLLPVGFAFAWLARDVGERARTALAAAFFVALGAGVYANQLSTGIEGRHALVGGVIPWSDAQGFISNAWRAMHGLTFSQEITGVAMRPLYPLTLTATLAIAGGNVKVVTLLYAGSVAALMARAAGRMGTRYGWRAFAGVLLVLAWFLRRYLFVIGTESLGVVAGLLAFDLFATALVRSDGELRASLVLPGAFLVLGVGLMARPGPFAAVVFLLLWVAHRAERSERWRLPLACAAAFALGIGFNTLVVRTTGERSSTTGGEFPPILYGALHGEDFTYLNQRHPEVAARPVTERMGATVRLIGSEIAERPWLAFGLLQGAGAFAAGPHGHFSLAFYDPDDAFFEGKAPIGAKLAAAGPYRVVNLVAMAVGAGLFVILSWLGFWRRRQERGAPRDLLAEAAQIVLLGATANACLTPPWITEGVQLQATTLPFFAILPWVYRGAPTAIAPVRALWAPPAAFAAWLLFSLVYVWTRSPSVPAGACAENGSRAMHLEPSLIVEVTAPGARGYTPDRVKTNLRFVGKHNKKFADYLLGAATPGLGIEMVFDACAGRASIVLDDAATLRARPRGWTWIDGGPRDTEGRIFRP